MLLEKSLLQKIKIVTHTAILILALFAIQPISAIGIGGYGGAFLREPVGATAFALGGAQTASPKYICSWWNPAAIVLNKKKSLVLGVGYRPLGRTEGYISYEFPLPPRAGVGLSVLYRGIPLIKGLVDDQEYPIKDCAYSTYSFRAGLSYLIRKNLSAGLNCSFYRQQLPTSLTTDNDVFYSSINTIGFDFGVRYRPLENLSYGLVFKNVLSNFKWEFTDDFSPMFEDTLPATVTLGQELKTNLMGKPLIWSCDFVGYLLNANFKPLAHGHVLINNGVEWQRWEIFFIRAGVRDIELNTDMFNNSSRYKDHFTLSICLGFSLDLTKALKGKDMRFNYGIATDKAGAGLDQQLDFIVSF